MNTKHSASVLIFASIFLSCFLSSAQNSSDTIKIVKKGLGYAYYKDNEMLNYTQLTHLTISNSEAVTLLRASKNMQVGAYIFGCLGGGCMGYSLGYALETAMRGNTLNKTLFFSMLGAGAVFVGIGIGFEVGANNKAKEGIVVFNNAIRQKNSANLDLGFSPLFA